MCSAQADVRFAPESGHSALQDKCPLSADNGHCLFDYLISSREKGCGYREAENPSRLGIDNQF
jgi:hypothetical protein